MGIAGCRLCISLIQAGGSVHVGIRLGVKDAGGIGVTFDLHMVVDVYFAFICENVDVVSSSRIIQAVNILVHQIVRQERCFKS